jgi:eukaryotic-like serine/threonine-protein kinase
MTARTSPATPDGRSILFSMGFYGAHSLWRMPVSNGKTGAAQRLEYAGEGVWQPTLSMRGNRLAFARWLGGGSEIWKVLAPLGSGKQTIQSRLIHSTADDEEPEYSPDGTRIAFKSNRSGRLEIWVCRADGSEPLQLTFRVGENTFIPRWSPDGRSILFTSNPDGNYDLFLIDSQGGVPRRLTSTPFNEVAAVFSRDGKWIYYHCDQTGQKQIWKMPIDSDGKCGTPEQITRHGGISPEESPDGRILFHLKEGTPRSLWKMPSAGGMEDQVLPSVVYDNFVAAEDGIYLIHSPNHNRYSLEFFDYASMKTTKILEPAGPGWGLTVSPTIEGNPRSILYVNCRPNDSDLMIVNDFR